MQQGSLIRSSRKRGPDVWQFRWADRGPCGKRIYRKRLIGTVCEYPDAESARTSVKALLREVNSNPLQRFAPPMTVAEVCEHFTQRELPNDNLWRSYSTKRAYKTYLKKWIVPHWGAARLSEVRTMKVESWLRQLPLAKSSCAKIRGLLSVVFNHACRHEFFDRNPIRLVRQGAKRRSAPNLLTPPEIKALIQRLGFAGTDARAPCSFYWLASERVVWLEVGRHQPCPGDNERHTLNRLWSGRPLQDRIVTETHAGSANRFGCTREMEGKLQIYELRRLGFREQTPQRSKANLASGNLAQVHSSRRTAARDSEAIRMAHVPAHILDVVAKRRNRIQSHAGAVAAFFFEIHVGCLHAGDFASKARCASSRPCAGLRS